VGAVQLAYDISQRDRVDTVLPSDPPELRWCLSHGVQSAAGPSVDTEHRSVVVIELFLFGVCSVVFLFV
jgi:hypothetical protein